MKLTDIQKNTLTNALYNACEALSDLESAGQYADSPVVEAQAREMLDALEAHLRILTPEVYS